MLFFYIRHGLPTYQPDALTPLGWEQAKALAKRFVTYGLDKVYTSSSTRAMETAQPTCELLRLEPVICEWAHEKLAFEGFGVQDTDGKRRWGWVVEWCREQFCSPEVRALGKEWYKHPCFADKNFEAGVERIDRETDALFLSLGYKHVREKNRFEKVGDSPERVALFAHEGFGKAFLSSLLDIPYPMYATQFGLSHSSMTVIYFNDNSDVVYPEVLQHSSDAHLYREGLMAGYRSNPKLKF